MFGTVTATDYCYCFHLCMFSFVLFVVCRSFRSNRNVLNNLSFRSSLSNQNPLIAPRSPLPAPRSSLIAHRSSLPAHHSPLTAHHSPLTAHLSPLTTHRSTLTAHRSPLNSHRSPFSSSISLSGPACLGKSRFGNPFPRQLRDVGIPMSWHAGLGGGIVPCNCV